ncbi:MAG: glycosyltransferase family 2 protein, partial [Flavobacteriales bacterium]
RRFGSIHSNGIIACFDADCSCDDNYLTALFRHFNTQAHVDACAVYFEHPLSGEEDEALYEGIAHYELYLRYYRMGLEYAGLPFAYHTVGSAIVVRSSTYCKLGGMNKRKAGEDFYFVSKIIKAGGFSNLLTTRVIPSPRISDRVPFGTGKAMGDYLHKGRLNMAIPPIELFTELRDFNSSLHDVFTGNDSVHGAAIGSYFASINYSERWDEIRSNISSFASFRKRFYRWFDALSVLKFVHFSLENGYFKAPGLLPAAASLLRIYTGKIELFEDVREMLQFYRDFDKQKTNKST